MLETLKTSYAYALAYTSDFGFVEWALVVIIFLMVCSLFKRRYVKTEVSKDAELAAMHNSIDRMIEAVRQSNSNAYGAVEQALGGLQEIIEHNNSTVKSVVESLKYENNEPSQN
jgi:hypothetical protein